MTRFILLNLRGLCRISSPELVDEEFSNSESVIHLPNLRYHLCGTNPEDLTDYPATDAAVSPMWFRIPRKPLSPTKTCRWLRYSNENHTRPLSSDVSEVTFTASYRNPSLGQLQDLPGEMREGCDRVTCSAIRGVVGTPGRAGTEQGGDKQLPQLPSLRLTHTLVCPLLPSRRAASPQSRTQVSPAPPLPPVLRGRGAHLKQVVSSPVDFRQGYRVVAILFSEQTSLQGGVSEY